MPGSADSSPVRRVPAVARRAPRGSAALPRQGGGGLTTRAAVLGLVLCALVVSAAVPVRELITQRAAISAAERAQHQQRERVAALQRQQELLQDPAHVRAEARQRLHLVMPGETAYQLLGPSTSPTAAPRTARQPGDGPSAPWYSSVWSSVRAADRAGGAG